MADKIADFLNDISLQNSSRGTWGIGTVIARAGAKVAHPTQVQLRVCISTICRELVLAHRLNIRVWERTSGCERPR